MGERDKNGVGRGAAVAKPELFAPPVEQRERLSPVAGFVAEIVGNAAVRINGMEVLAEPRGEEPAGDMEIFVMGFGQAAAPGLRLPEHGRFGGRAILGRQGGPAGCEQVFLREGRRGRGQGRITVLIERGRAPSASAR